MWQKAYRDYPEDTSQIKNQVESGKGIIGCEMHEINGWGNLLQIPPKKKPSLMRTLLTLLMQK